MFMVGVVIVLLTVLPAVLPPLPPPPMILMGIPVVLMAMLIHLAIYHPPLSSFDTTYLDM
ncbi:hypothetical protein F2Q68_00028240 [Brassica cretica]|uniref:Uncharacterized protein n=1 Tax=Brassica cretica TaxID=69181 RepID=A0A8S9IC94_BRACR|nr:hypothetical protein F2Q68_00028240 [Brassica cretica]